jgi:hypothetical protein
VAGEAEAAEREQSERDGDALLRGSQPVENAGAQVRRDLLDIHFMEAQPVE